MFGRVLGFVSFRDSVTGYGGLSFIPPVNCSFPCWRKPTVPEVPLVLFSGGETVFTGRNLPILVSHVKWKLPCGQSPEERMAHLKAASFSD